MSAISRAAFMLASGMGAACDPISSLRGVVHTPLDGCSARSDQAVVDAEVQLVCRNLDERSAEPNPSHSDDRGEFAFYMASFDTFSPTCWVRVTKPGYRPFEASLSALNYRAGPATREVLVDVRLQRVSSR